MPRYVGANGVFENPPQADFSGTGPLPHPTAHERTLMGGRVGEWAGAASWSRM